MANQNSLNNLSYGFTLPSLNLNFTSTAQRITGDMSNATHNNRLAFQSSTVNGNSSLFVLPNGTGTSSSAVCSNASDPTNSAFAQMQIDATSVKFISSVLGTGTQLPMEIRIGATAAIDISTNRAVSIVNTVAGNTPLTVTGTTSGAIVINQAPVATALTVNGANTAGTYAQVTNAFIAGGLFNANRCINLDGTAGSGCQIEVAVAAQAAVTGGDASVRFVNYGVQGVLVGLDTSANQFSMSAGNLGDANTFFTYGTATTQINLPRQCSFNVEVGVNLPNVTGAGAAYAVPFGSTRYNIGGGFAGNIFVAPVAGKYLFSGSLRISGITALMTYMQIVIPNAGGNYLFGICNPAMIAAIAGAPNTLCVPFSIIMSMNAGEFTFVQLLISGGAGNTAGVNALTSFWSGQLLS